MLKEFINEICEILDIDVPDIVVNSDIPVVQNLMACVVPSGQTIYIATSGDKFHPDIIFSVCHELRHIWQLNNKNKKFLDDYKPRNFFEDADEYNQQLAEIDANAFGVVVMSDLFKIKPQFNGLSSETKKLIFDYARGMDI